ncbi:MAG: alpha/beta hydrolase [Pseudomonadota bacterium]
MSVRYGTVQAPGADVHFMQQGQGPDVVWVPAGDQTHDAYQAQFDALSHRYRCTSFDPRGAGKTAVHDAAPWPIEQFAGDCAALIAEVCKPPVVVIGLSLGALITQEMCLSYPELVRLGIPMGTMARKTGYALEWEGAEIAMAAKGLSLPADFSVIHYAALSYPAEVLGDDALWQKCRPFVASSYEDRDPRLLAAQWQACLEYDSLERLPHCKVPIHVIAFEQDLQTPPARGKAVADAAADGHFHLLEGMGHFSIFGHRPDEVTACIEGILRNYEQ